MVAKDAAGWKFHAAAPNTHSSIPATSKPGNKPTVSKLRPYFLALTAGLPVTMGFSPATAAGAAGLISSGLSSLYRGK